MCVCKWNIDRIPLQRLARGAYASSHTNGELSRFCFPLIAGQLQLVSPRALSESSPKRPIRAETSEKLTKMMDA